MPVAETIPLSAAAPRTRPTTTALEAHLHAHEAAVEELPPRLLEAVEERVVKVGELLRGRGLARCAEHGLRRGAGPC